MSCGESLGGLACVSVKSHEKTVVPAVFSLSRPAEIRGVAYSPELQNKPIDEQLNG